MRFYIKLIPNKLFDESNDFIIKAEELDKSEAVFERRKTAEVKEVVLKKGLNPYLYEPYTIVKKDENVVPALARAILKQAGLPAYF